MTNENKWERTNDTVNHNQNVWDPTRLDAEHHQLLTQLSEIMGADIVDVLDIIIGRYLCDAKSAINEHRSAIETMRTTFVNGGYIADIMVGFPEKK